MLYKRRLGIKERVSVENDRYVYGLFRPDTAEIFYVGMGMGQRAWTHEKNRKNNGGRKNQLICHLIDDLGFLEIPVVIFRSNLSLPEACDLETALIYALGREPFGPLLNVHQGGAGSFDCSSDTRAAMSSAAKARDRTGEWEQRRIEAARSPEARAKQSLARKGKPLWPNGRVDPRSDEGRRLWAEKMAGRRWFTDGVNVTKVFPENAPPGWFPGRPDASLEAKEKMAIAKRGKTLSEEHKRKVGDAHRGQRRSHFDASWWSSPEGKAHNKRIWINDGKTETRALPNAAIPEGWSRGRLPGKAGGHNKGKPMSLEARRHLSELNKGKAISDEAKAKISAALTGRPKSPKAQDSGSLVK